MKWVEPTTSYGITADYLWTAYPVFNLTTYAGGYLGGVKTYNVVRDWNLKAVFRKKVESDATLSSLLLGEVSLNPAFQSDVTSYSASVPAGTSTINVTAVASQDAATVQINGTLVESGSSHSVELAAGNTVLQILVTSEDGTEKLYNVTIYKEVAAMIDPPNQWRERWYTSPVTMTYLLRILRNTVWMGAQWTAYSAPVVVDQEGTHHVQYRRSVNTEETGSLRSISILRLLRTQRCRQTLQRRPTSDVTVTISYPDDAAVKEYKVGDNGTWTEYGAPVVVSENGTVYARATDAVGNVSNVTSYTVSNIDHIAPVDATLAVDTTTPTNQGVTVTISYPDDAAAKEYKVGESGAWTAYTAPVVVSDNDTVYARGTDAVGNVSNVTSMTVSNIYKIAPVTAATLSPAAPNGKNSWYTTDVTVSLSVTASVYGGAVTTEYQVNDGAWITYNGSIPAFGEGTYKVGYRSKDQAGNVEQLKTVEFKVDKMAPALSVQLDKTSIWPADHKMVTINATLNSSDATSGVESVVLTSITSNKPDSGQGDIQADFGTAATSFNLRAEKDRIYTITYTATDKAGNKTVVTATVTVPHDQS